MGSVDVDQIGPDGSLLYDRDMRLSEARRNDLLLAALPGSTLEVLAGERVVLYRDQLILKRQIHHLGYPWPEHKKRIQIPNKWLEVHRQALAERLTPRFVGIYSYGSVTIFVDFDPASYVTRKANNSSAHVATNDLFQAQTLGHFARQDSNGNWLTSVRFDEFAAYLDGSIRDWGARLDVFEAFNREILREGRINALDAVREMHEVRWPDRFQGEWAGFYLEYRLDEFVRRNDLTHEVAFQRVKVKGGYDYDLVFPHDNRVQFYGDLKASNIAKHESPGNDAADLLRCVADYGRFWYVIYEHDTWHGRGSGNLTTIQWNELRRDLGHRPAKGYNELSYAGKFKEAVEFTGMMILEVNESNFRIVLGDYHQGHQQDGADRALKVMIAKRNIDNFLIFSAVR